MAAYLGYTLQMKTLFRGLPVRVHDKHTRRRRRLQAVGGWVQTEIGEMVYPPIVVLTGPDVHQLH